MISLPLQQFVSLYLGSYHPNDLTFPNPNERAWSSRRIPKDVADLILAECQNKHTCYVEYPDKFSSTKQECILHDFVTWTIGVERRERLRKVEDQRRKDEDLLAQNSIIVARYILNSIELEHYQAVSQARKMLLKKEWNKINLFGCTKEKLLTLEDLEEDRLM